MEITREGQHYVCRFGYDADVIAELKRTIPGRHRRWDSGRKAWLIDVWSWPLAERVFQEFGMLEGVFTPDVAWRTLYLLPDAPALVVDAAFKALAKVHHPDHEGGDEKRMRDINLAYEKLRGNR